MRKPKAHEIFELPQEPGLSNLLVGNAKASEAVRKSGVAGLWVIPSGRMPPNPAELLGSPAFRDFLASLKDHFDWVIIDSPPVMAVTDAALVAHHATGVVFVVGAEMTSRHAAKRAVDQLRAGPGEVRRRRPQPGRPRAQRLLLLAVLPARIRQDYSAKSA